MKDVNKQLNHSKKVAKEFQKSLELDSTDIKSCDKAFENLNDALVTCDKKTEELQKEFDRLSDVDLPVKELEKLEAAISENEKRTEQLNAELKKLEDAEAPDEEIKKMTQQLEEAEEASRLLNAEVKKWENWQIPVDTLQKLEVQILRSSNEAKTLTKEIEKVDTQLRSLTTVTIEELAEDTSKASVEMKEYSNATDAASEATQGLAQAGGDAAGSIGNVSNMAIQGAESFGIWGAAIGAVVGSLMTLQQEAQATDDFLEAYGSTLVETNLNLTELNSTTQTFAAYMGMEVQEAAQIASDSMKLFGETVYSTEGAMLAMVTTMGILNSNTLSVEESQTILNTTMNTFNATQQEAIGLLGDSIALFQEYGKQADDIADTFREWGSLFEGMGFSAQEFFTILEQGLILGAKNTDEVANAFNEMNLSILEGSAEVEQALSAIGLSLEDMQALITNGNGQQAFAEIILAMNETALAMGGVEVASEELMLVCQTLFGTMGEEWIYSLVTNTEAMTSLSNAMSVSSARATVLADTLAKMGVTAGTQEEQIAQLTSILVTYSDQLGITSVEAENMAVAIITGGLASLTARQALSFLSLAVAEVTGVVADSTEAISLYNEKLVGMVAAGMMNEQQLMALTSTFQTMAEDGLSTAEKETILFTLAMIALYNRGAITKQQIEDLTRVLQAYTSGATIANQNSAILTERMYELAAANGYTKEQVDILTGYLQDLDESIKTGTVDTYDYDSALRGMENALGLSSEQAKLLLDSMIILRDETATAEEQMTAMANATTVMHGAALITDEEFKNLSSALGTLKATMDDGTASTSDMTEELINAGEETQETGEHFGTFSDAILDSISKSENFRAEMEKMQDELNDVESAADSAGLALSNMTSDANTAISSGNSATSSHSMLSFVPTMPTIQTMQSSNSTSHQDNRKVHNSVSVTIKIDGLSGSDMDLEKLADAVAEKVDEKLGGLHY